MLLSDRQRIAMNLAGTVPIPSPPPALGRIEIVCPIALLSKRGKGKVSGDDIDRILAATLVTVIHEVSPRMTVTRTVALGDVTAAYLEGDDPSPVIDCDPKRWLLPHTLKGLVAEFAAEAAESDGAARGRLVLAEEGVIFVPEAARVLVQVEAGMTAAESQDCSHMFPRFSSALHHLECKMDHDPY